MSEPAANGRLAVHPYSSDETKTDPHGRFQINWASKDHGLHCLVARDFLGLRNGAFKADKDYHEAADLTGQADYLGATIEADIVKQKLPTTNGGYKALNMGSSSYGKIDERMYTDLCSDHPIDLCRYQVANGYMGRVGLINSGGESGKYDLAAAVATDRAG